MANLETLELTIRANALSASRGLEKLISSLTSLSSRVSTSVGGLRELNAELQKLSGYAGIKLPRLNLTGLSSGRNGVSGIERETRAIRARAGVMKEFAKLPANSFRSWMYGPRPLPEVTNLMAGSAGMASESARRSANPQWYVEPGSKEWNARIAARNAALERNAGRTFASDPNPEKLAMAAKGDIEGIREWTRNIQAVREGKTVWSGEVKRLLDHLNAGSPTQNLAGFINQTMGIGAEPKSAQDSASVFMEQMREQIPFIERAKNAIGKLKEGFGKFRENLGGIIPHFKLFNRMLRIAQTMMIRMAIRALFAGMKEGFQNYYQYAKATNGAFAKEMDSVSSAWAQLKNQMGSAMAGAVSAALPAITVLCNALVTAFNYASQLFALLSGKKSWSKATTQVKEFGNAVNNAGGGGGGGGGLKELLADFDELNVIASESGGGGGGGGAADTAEEFTDMFEEMYSFDKGIKDIVTWLEEHLPIVNAAVAALVSKLLGFSAPLTLTITGIVLSYSAGYDIGVNGLNATNFWEAAGGVLASTLGGTWLGFKVGGAYGAVIGAVIGFSFSMVALGVGLSEGEKKKLYGRVHWEAEKIREEINKLFKFDDVQVVIDELVISHYELEEAKDEVVRRLEQMKLSVAFDVIKLGVNKGATTEEMLKDVDAVVAAVQKLINLRKKSITFGLKVTTQFTNPQEIISFSDEQWSELDAYVTDLGNQIGDMISDGISIDEVDVIQRLQSQLNNVVEAIEMGKYASQFVEGFSRGYAGTVWENLDEETLKSYTGGYIESRNAFMEAVRMQAEDTKESLGSLYYAMLAREKDNPGTYTPEEIETARQSWMAFDVDRDVLDKWNEYGEAGRLMYTRNTSAALSAVIGRKEDFDTSKMRSTLQGKVENIRDWLVDVVAVNIGYDNKVLMNVLDTMEFTGWELLGEDLRTKFVRTLQREFGISSDLYVQLKSQLNVPIEDILSTNKQAWDTWELKEKLKFINALVVAYGGEETMRVAKEMGIDVQAAIDEGLASENEKTKAGTKQLVERIRAGVQGSDFESTGASIANAIAAGMVGSAASVKTAAMSLIKDLDNVFSKKYYITVGLTTDGSTVTTNMQTNNGKTVVGLSKSMYKATGAYGIPAGDVFVANDNGAELVGSINGKTSVANQQQIIEGISQGVATANSEQNNLLRQQNELLRAILDKDNSVRLGASVALGRTVQQSLDMFASVGGR